jgi:phosphatidate cytidylyltransferase
LTAAAVLPPLLVLVIFAPAWAITAFVGLCTLWGLYEIAAMTAAGPAASLAGLLVAGAVPATIALGRFAPAASAALAAAAIAAICGLLLKVARGSVQSRPSRQLLVGLGALYVGALFPFFALLRNQPNGVPLLLLMLAAVIAGDSGAYFVGRAIGRVKLIPQVSPGKTVEGALAYLVCSVAAACALKVPLGVNCDMGTAAGFGMLVGVVAQVGDLAESAFKRVAGVKDSGWLFPGHGGLLDRTDSLVFAAFFAYYYSRWLGFASA